MKILYHHRTQAEDGQAIHIRSLIQAFLAGGHEVREEALVRRTSPEPRGTARRGGSVWALAGVMPRFMRELAEYGYSRPARRRLIRAAREFGPDFLYERYAFGNAAGVGAARALGVPLVLEVNSPMVHELSRTRGLSFPRLARRVERSIFCAADLLCAVSEVLAGMLVEMGVRRERIIVTPNGVHPEQYSAMDREAALGELGLSPDTGPVLGFVGYYRDWHRLDLVVEGLHSAGLRDAHLILVGAGPAEAALRQRASALQVADRVHFAGPRPHQEIPALLAAFDVALVPAINAYASPLKLHEYMAAGRSIVAPDQPNITEVLTDGHDALLVSPGDGAALLAALRRLVSDAHLRERLGQTARRTVQERDLTWAANVQRVVGAVKELS